MKIFIFIAACLMLLVSTGRSQAEISQQFDKSGRLILADKKALSSQPQRIKKYSVPEGIELRPDVHYEFYPVFGKTFAEIVRSTEENGPRNDKARKRQPSALAWNLGWTYDFSFSLEPDEEGEKVHCDLMLVDPVLSYDITVTLPALTDDSALNPTEKDLWKNYVVTLVERMHGRAKIIKDDTQDVILRQFGDIAYILLSTEEAENAEKFVERFVRAETVKMGGAIIKEIQQKLETYDSGTTQETGTAPARVMPRRRLPVR